MNTYYFIKSKFSVLLLIFIFILSSCITNRDLEYIRSNKEIKEVKVNKQDYRLQVGDLLSVQISTVTEQLHDFFNKDSLGSGVPSGMEILGREV